MFTGLIETTGKIVSVTPLSNGKRIVIETSFTGDLKEGESISVDGVCLSVESFNSRTFTVFLSKETLRVSKFGKKLNIGQKVNLERAMKAEDRFGGHIVTGHVDTIASLRKINRFGDTVEWHIGGISKNNLKFLVEKGSVAVDGVSLTVNQLLVDGFTVFLIPLTLEVTTFGRKRVGDLLNIEFDILGKYVNRILSLRSGR